MIFNVICHTTFIFTGSSPFLLRSNERREWWNSYLMRMRQLLSPINLMVSQLYWIHYQCFIFAIKACIKSQAHLVLHRNVCAHTESITQRMHFAMPLHLDTPMEALVKPKYWFPWLLLLLLLMDFSDKMTALTENSCLRAVSIQASLKLMVMLCPIHFCWHLVVKEDSLEKGYVLNIWQTCHHTSTVHQRELLKTTEQV